MIGHLPDERYRVTLTLDDYEHYVDMQDRRLYLTAPIDNDCLDYGMSNATGITDAIINYNREDRETEVEKRKPIRLYINSPGGDISDGFSIVGAIEVSKTPVYTINIGQWSSMAFLIGITGHRRFSLPKMTFLMHDGSSLTFGSANKVKDRIDFEKRFERDVIRAHVLKHSHMKPVEYDALTRVEYYLLPEDAVEHGFIDEIVTDIDSIL